MNKELGKLKLYFNGEIPLSRTQALKILSTLEKELDALKIIRKYYYGNGVLFGEMTQEELDFIKGVLYEKEN